MSERGKRIRALRKKAPMSQALLAEKLGVSKRTIINYETGKTDPSLETTMKIANVLGIDHDLIEYGEKAETKIPVYEKLKSVEIGGDIIDYEERPNHWDKDCEYFALKVPDDTMQPRMYPNDVVVVRKQNDINTGEFAIVIVDKKDAIIRKVIKSDNGLTLQPLNYNYQSDFYSNEDIASLPISILGRVIELRAKY